MESEGDGPQGKPGGTGRQILQNRLVDFGLEPQSHRKPLKGLYKGVVVSGWNL